MAVSTRRDRSAPKVSRAKAVYDLFANQRDGFFKVAIQP
jgi:hypothetical protein